MISILSELHFWTTQEDIIIKNTDYGAFKYYVKKESNDSLYGQSKKIYCEQRGTFWNLPNKRPQKLRDRLKELEDHLIHNRVVSFTWEECTLKLLLSTGMLVTIPLNSRTGDPTNITFDKQLSAKLQVNIICDGTIFGNQVICICNDGHVLGFGGQWKDGWVLEGGPRRKLNYHGDWLAVWGKAGAEHPQPWSPLAKDHQRANLHLYWIGSRDPELLSYKKTDGEPLQVVVSKFRNRTLIVTEQRVTQRGSVSVEVSNFELVGNNLKRVSVTSVPLQTQVSCSTMSYLEDRLLICCIDGSLALLDRNRGSTRTIKASFIPTMAAWHPDGAVVAISNEKGQLQYFDTSLNCLRTQFSNEECTPTTMINLSNYFTTQFSIASINWGPKDLIVSFEQGPIAVITHMEKSLKFKSLVQNYLIVGKVDEAIKLLLSWEFREEAFSALQKIVAHLMRQPLTAETAQYLQNALGSYHSSPVPLRPQIRHRYGNQVISMTRRFFHQLARAQMFETAFLLAVDVGHHDLFMDLHYIAVQIGETEMAAAARAQASSLLSRCSSEASNCSRSSCSQCSDSGSSSSEDDNHSDNQKSQKTTGTKSYVPPLPLNSDNCLSTDFNQPDPTTYQPSSEKPVVLITSQSEYSRTSYTPRATYVKAPQVPSNFIKAKFSASSLGIPYPQSTTPFAENFQANPKPVISSSFSLNGNFFSNSTMSTSFLSNGNTAIDNKLIPNSTYSAFTSSNLSVSSTKKSSTPVNKVLPPPLPDLSSSSSSNNPDLINFSSHVQSSAKPPPYPQQNASESSFANGGKKHQPKVKFSDTVTAFIVPEIKRPHRPLPPPHVTDPQKELADSLPLCHPNEDYLKDFAPVRKEVHCCDSVWALIYKNVAKWGIAGSGKISSDFVASLKGLPSCQHEVVAIAARSQGSANKFAKTHNIPSAYEGYEKLAKDPNIDIVYVGILNPQHYEVSKQMLENGKHVLCEKPFTLNETQTRKLIELGEEKKLFLMEAVWSRCFPAYRELKKILDSGKIGEVIQVMAEFGFDIKDVDRIKSKQLGGGTILDLGVYVLQFQQFVFRGLKPLKLIATGHLNEEGVDISMAAIMTYPGGKTAVMSTSALLNLSNRATIYGTKGTIVVEKMWCPTTLEVNGELLEFPLLPNDSPFDHINSSGLAYQAAEARKCILEGKIESPQIPHEETIQLAQWMDKLRKELGVVYSTDNKPF
ncbi:hypothetical protein JTB14_003630 [Gonioctena quinquepunctata]|nr:hypothetical protein JTB14_003630 [Gonioctena quinquepunctata]